MRINSVALIDWRLQRDHFKTKTTGWTTYWGELCEKRAKLSTLLTISHPRTVISVDTSPVFFKTWWRHILDWLWNNIFRCIINDYWYTFFYTSWSLWTSANHLRDLTCKVLNLMIKIKNLLLTKIVISETTLGSQIVRLQ